jgi:hypothetical protein
VEEEVLLPDCVDRAGRPDAGFAARERRRALACEARDEKPAQVGVLGSRRAAQPPSAIATISRTRSHIPAGTLRRASSESSMREMVASGPHDQRAFAVGDERTGG